METKEMHKCYGGSSHKKVFIILGGLVFLAIIALGVASVGWKMHEFGNNGNMMQGFNGDFGRGNRNYVVPTPSDAGNQFVLPFDASKSGELAIVVGDLEVAKKAISDIALKSDGNVYATFIAYASKNVKNGSVVVQVPVENFDAVFGDLKKVGSQVVQEQTLQIAPQNFYPMPLSTEKNVSDTTATQQKAEVTEASPTQDAKPEIAIYPTPAQVQNKGYIRVVFVDYGNKNINKERNEKEDITGNIIGIGNPANGDMRNNLLIIVGLKLVFLIAIFGLLIVVFKKLFNRIKRRKENHTKVHVVRQLSKTHKRVVKVQAKRRKL